jgi:hypothetical protein
MNPYRSFEAMPLSMFVLAASAAQAMQIRQFDKMADRDQSEYIGDLIVGAENALASEGKPDLGAQIKTLRLSWSETEDRGETQESSPRGGLTRRYRATEIGSPWPDSTRVVANNMRAAGKQMVTVVPTST